MRFSSLPVLMDENVHCAPALENHTSYLVMLNSQKVLPVFKQKGAAAMPLPPSC
jgi:hypothetical protein